MIFSGYHLTSSPEFDICANAGVLYYNNNTQKAWTDRYSKDPAKYWSIFQTDPNEEWYGGGFARYLNFLVESGQFKPEKGKTAAILAGDDTYSAFIGTTFNDTATELSTRFSPLGRKGERRRCRGRRPGFGLPDEGSTDRCPTPAPAEATAPAPATAGSEAGHQRGRRLPHQRFHRRGWHRDAQRRRDGR